MKKTLLLFCVMLYSISFAFSQFEWVNPIPQEKTLNSVFMVDDQGISNIAQNESNLELKDGVFSYQILNPSPNQYDLNNIFRFNDSIVITTNGYIKRSIDNGNSWEMILLSGFSASSFHFINYNKGFVLANTGVYKTNDGGWSWDYISTFSDQFQYYFHINKNNNGFIFAGRSTSGGGYVSWTYQTVDGAYNWK